MSPKQIDESIGRACKYLRKTYIPYPLIRTRTCAYSGGQKCKFFGKLCVCTKWLTPALKPQRSTLIDILIFFNLENFFTFLERKFF